MEKKKADVKAKVEKVIKIAGLKGEDSTTTGLRKLDRAMSKAFGKDYDTKLQPLGIKLSEKVSQKKKTDWTASGTVKCKFQPWSCGADADF